jgi:hypothetical protein
MKFNHVELSAIDNDKRRETGASDIECRESFGAAALGAIAMPNSNPTTPTATTKFERLQLPIKQVRPFAFELN